MKDYLVSKLTVCGKISNEIDKLSINGTNRCVTMGMARACEIMLDTEIAGTHEIKCEELDVMADWFMENTECDHCLIKERCKDNCHDNWMSALTEIITFGKLMSDKNDE